MNYRNEHLTRLAKDKPCMFNVPGVCNRRTDTTVWCHSNELRHGKGRGIRAHDPFGAFGCYACHTWLDHGSAPREEKVQAFRDAFERTLIYLWAYGLVTVAGYSKPSSRPPREKPPKASSLSSSKMLPRRQA